MTSISKNGKHPYILHLGNTIGVPVSDATNNGGSGGAAISSAGLVADVQGGTGDLIDDAVERVKRYLSQQKNPEKWVKKAKEKALRIMEEREFRSIHILAYEYPMKTDRPRTAGGHTFSPNAAANKNYFDKAIKKVVDTIKLINTPAEIIVEAYLEMPK